MGYSIERQREIYERTNGRCHICRKQLAWCNYGVLGTHGAWEVEHSIPRAAGGTDHLNNLYPACIGCNRSKGDGSTRSETGHPPGLFNLASGLTMSQMTDWESQWRRLSRRITIWSATAESFIKMQEGARNANDDLHTKANNAICCEGNLILEEVDRLELSSY